MFPCCYPGIAGSQGGLQYFATDEDKQSILAYFSKTQDPFLRERNSLMLELSDRAGWRAGTVNGLLVDDFNAGAIERARDDRSEERSEGKEWVRTCRLRWTPAL